MPTLNVTVTRGFTAVPGVPITLDDLNAGFLPVVVIEGELLETVTPSVARPGPYWTGTASGSGGAYALTLNPAPTTLEAGLWCSFKANHANPGAATLNLNTLGAIAIQTPHGQALVGGEIQSGQEVWVQYTGSVWQMVSAPTMRSALYAVDSGAANAYVISIPGITLNALSSLVGQQIVFKASAANTGASTLAVNGLTATAISKKGSTALSANDIQTGAMVAVVYDGTTFQLASFVEAPALPAVGASGSITYPYSFTVDTEGRVTAKAGGAYVSSEEAVPAGGAATAPWTHSLGRKPIHVRAVLVAQDPPDTSYTAGDELAVEATHFADFPVFAVTTSSTTIVVTRWATATGFEVPNKGNGARITADAAKWKVKVYAW